MAGIGFELRKLYAVKGVLPRIKAYLFSITVTIGPTLLCILMLMALQKLLFDLGVDAAKRELFMAAIIYSFIFSLIITSGLIMLLSRYVADKIYKNEYEDILPSLYGTITICVIAGGITGLVFYLRSPLNFSFKLAAYMLFIELIILWIQMVYVSALRDYSRLVKGFLVGNVTGIAVSYVLVCLLAVDMITAVLISMDIGFFVILIFFSINIHAFFRNNSGKYFDFLGYLDKYPSLFFINMLYTFGLYTHNFIVWGAGYQVSAAGTYVFAPLYDVPSFWAFLSVMPALVMFMVTGETSFYEKQKSFYDTICNQGVLDDIEHAKGEMKDTLSRNLRHIMGTQLVISILCLVLGMYFLPWSGLPSATIALFDILVIGCYAFIIMFIFLLILLYFDDRKGALLVVAVFAFASTIFTMITIYLGEAYYGLGFTGASFLSLAIGFFRLDFFIKNIDYFTFCSQPVVPCDQGKKIFTRAVEKLRVITAGKTRI